MLYIQALMSAAVDLGLKAFSCYWFSLSDYEWNADFESIKPFIQQNNNGVLKTNFKRC
jgi:5'-nucleotidase